MKRLLILRSFALSYTLLLAALPAPAPAQERGEKAARELVEGVLRKMDESPASNLDVWTRSVLERALDHERKNAAETSTPFPAEDQAGGLADSLSVPPHGPEVIVFMSLSVPAAAWREWSREAARIGAPLVLRGVTKESLKATVKRVGAYLDESGGAAIDPRLFRLFAIDVVPAVAVVPGGVPPCSSKNCSKDPPPPHDLVKGNIGLDAALRIAAAEDGPGRGAARRHLARLRGDFP